MILCFYKQKTEYEMRISDWSSDVCSSDLATVNGEEKVLTSSFLWACSGYYDYDQGFTPDFAGTEDFAGQIVHPQHWPEDLDHTGKKVVIIGSGATAVPLVPALADEAAPVQMQIGRASCRDSVCPYV